MSEPRPNRIGLFLLVAAVVALIAGANAWKTSLKVRRVDVRGNRLVQTNEVLQLAHVPQNALLYTADLTAIEQNVMSHHYVRDAVVERDLPSTLRITVRERIPIAIVNRGEPLYLDEEGVVLPRTIARHLLDLPVISGVPGSVTLPLGSRVKGSDVAEALRVLVALRILNKELYHNISEVHLRGNGDVVMYAAERGVPILFGQGGVAPKLVRLESFWRAVVRDRGVQSLEYVDLRFESQVVARWSDDITKNM